MTIASSSSVNKDAHNVHTKSDAIAVGSKAWVFNENRRRYSPAEPGKMWGSLIYREHWEESSVVGETRDSWIVGTSKVKVNKKTGEHKRNPWCKKVVFSIAAVDDDVWINSHCPSVVRALQQCHDADKIRQIATILGYTGNQ